MAIQENNVVTPLRPAKSKRSDNTAALRQRRSRARRKRVTPVPATAIAQIAQPEKPNENNVRVTVGAMHATDVTGERGATQTNAPGIVTASYLAALGLAAVSAGFSITGMTNIFIGALWPVIAMGVALEVGKLSAVAAMPTLRWGALKVALAVLVVTLMGLNVIGAFGFLSKAHIAHAVEGDVTIAGKVADVDARIGVQAGIVEDLNRRLAQIDGAIEKATSKGRTGAAMALADRQHKVRSDLVFQRTAEAKKLAELQVEKAGIEGRHKMAKADLGPVNYLAMLLGADNETALRWFVLVVAVLLDPAAVLLLLAASSARR